MVTRMCSSAEGYEHIKKLACLAEISKLSQSSDVSYLTHLLGLRQSCRVLLLFGHGVCLGRSRRHGDTGCREDRQGKRRGC